MNLPDGPDGGICQLTNVSLATKDVYHGHEQLPKGVTMRRHNVYERKCDVSERRGESFHGTYS